MIEPICFVKQR